MPVPKTQDLPPPGGYQKINFVKVPAKTLFNGYQLIGAYIGEGKLKNLLFSALISNFLLLISRYYNIRCLYFPSHKPTNSA